MMRAWVLRCVGLVLLLGSVAAPVLAQDRWIPPNKDRGMLQWVVMLGVLILICIPAFLNPKRSHMD